MLENARLLTFPKWYTSNRTVFSRCTSSFIRFKFIKHKSWRTIKKIPKDNFCLLKPKLAEFALDFAVDPIKPALMYLARYLISVYILTVSQAINRLISQLKDSNKDHPFLLDQVAKVSWATIRSNWFSPPFSTPITHSSQSVLCSFSLIHIIFRSMNSLDVHNNMLRPYLTSPVRFYRFSVSVYVIDHGSLGSSVRIYLSFFLVFLTWIQTLSFLLKINCINFSKLCTLFDFSEWTQQMWVVHCQELNVPTEDVPLFDWRRSSGLCICLQNPAVTLVRGSNSMLPGWLPHLTY